MTRDEALDGVAVAVGLRLMPQATKRRMRLELARQLHDPPTWAEVDHLADEDRLLSGERPPKNANDHARLARAVREADEPPFDEEFWRRRRADLRAGGFDAEEAAAVVSAVRASITHPQPEGDPQ